MTVVGADGNLYLNWENVANSVWSGWQNLGAAGGGFKLMPAMIEQQNGNTVLVEVGADTNVYFNWQKSNGTWAGWGGLGNAGGGFTTTPAVLVQPGGNTVITAVGADGSLYLNCENVANSVWSGWQNLGAPGGGFWSTPAMVEQQNGNTVLIAVGLDHNAYVNWQMSSGTWAGWGSLGSAGGGFTTTPVALVQPSGNTVATAVGADGNLYVNWQNASTEAWSGWGNLGEVGGGFTTPAMIEQHNGNTVLVDVGADKNVYFDWQNATTEAWSGWGNLGEAGGGFISMVSLSGQITAGGSGLSGVTVTLTGNAVAGTSFSQTTTTNFNGNYAFSVPSGGTYTVTPSLSGYTFNPNSQQFTNVSGNNIQNFTVSTESSVLTGNPQPQPSPQSAPAPVSPPVISASAQNCNDISGTWTDGIANNYALRQSGSLVSGTITTYDACGFFNGSIQGNATGIGTFSLIATAPSTDSCGDPISATTANVSVTVSGCSDAQVTVSSGTGGSGFLGSGGGSTSGSVTWSRTSTPPGVTVSVDVNAGKVNVTLSGQNKSATLSSKIVTSGSQSTSLASHNGASAGSSFSDSLQRTSLPVGPYGSVTSTWDEISVTVPVSFYVLGNTRFSQYNFPYESQCSNNPQSAWILYAIDSACHYVPTSLGAQFLTQTNVNGTGVSLANQVLKSYAASGAKYVCPPAPRGISDGTNTFAAVDAGGNTITKITGTNNTVLSDGTGFPNAFVNDNPRLGSLAKDPKSTILQFGDQILLVDSSDDPNPDMRSIQDQCPACSSGFGPPNWPGTVAHIDTFNSSGTRNPAAVGDYGNRTAIRLR